MLDEKQVTQDEAELWNEVNNPPEKTYDLFGKVELQIFKGAYQSGTRGAVPFNPAVHQKAQIIIKMYIQPLAEMDVKYPKHLEYESPNWADWGKITFPSIKALGINDAREINNMWARVARVPNGKKYDKKDAQGNPTGEKGDELTFKFVAFFADEDACRAAYLAAGGRPADANGNGNGHNVPAQVAPSNEDTERATAYQFLKVIVGNAAKGKESFAEAQEAVGLALAQYPTVSKFYLANSVETGELITQVTGKLPF
jgi:hypothetical protein